MRIGRVIGKLSLVKVHPSLTGKRWVLALPQSLKALAGQSVPEPEELVVIDELGATPGDLIGITEGGEATVPYFPQKKPVDAYNALILDRLQLNEQEVAKLV